MNEAPKDPGTRKDRNSERKVTATKALEEHAKQIGIDAELAGALLGRVINAALHGKTQD